MEIAVLQVRDHHSADGVWLDVNDVDKDLLSECVLDVAGYVVAEDDVWIVLAQSVQSERRVQNTWHLIKSAILTERRYTVGTANDLERRRTAPKPRRGA